MDVRKRKDFILKSSSDFQNESYYEFKKKFLILYLILIELLSEISVESKDKALLLYKIFKIYFVQQEKKYLFTNKKMTEKVKFYKELCKTVIQQSTTHLEKVEVINEVLFSNKLTKGTNTLKKTI